MSSILTLDFETAYGKHPTTKENITLTSLTTEEYVRHPDFKVHGCGIKLGERPTKWFSGEELPEVFAKIPWRHMAVAAHHAHFDGAILNWLYGHQPLFWLDTMLMSRALWPWRSASLAKVAERCGVGKKGRELVNFKNKWWLTPDEERVLAGYCENDVDLTFDILNMLRQRLPIEELRLQDLTIRMFTEPVIEVNRSILLEEYKRELREKRAFMRQAGTDRKVLMSNDKFAAELEKLGVTPPRKISGRTGKPTYAFAKSDEGFKQLQTHEDERVQWLVEARLAVKSTIKETRAKRFYKIGSRGAFPVYLNYYGAHTGRWSGGDKQNPQNMNRYDPRDPTSGALRRSWEAPEGHVVVVRDLSQIEARVLAYWAGQEDMVEVFANGGDPYNHMASQLYGRPVDRKNNPDDKPAGMVGKATVLGCFGPETKVVTSNGTKKITEITPKDRVWDGVEFVQHQGVLYQGEKECLTYLGVSATQDHEILTGRGWQEWSVVLTQPFLFRSALRLANLPSSAGNELPGAGVATSHPKYDASAAGKVWWTGTISKVGRLRDVIPVLKRRARRHEKCTGGMQISSRITSIEPAYSTGSLLVSPVAIQRTTPATRITEGVGSTYTSLGGKTGGLFSRTLSRWKAGITRISSWTERITARGTSPAISDSAQGQRTHRTEGPSQASKRKLPTYDIAFAGPRHRFTVMTECGPILVHNCGYGMGWVKFQESLRVGFLGMPGIIFDEEFVTALDVDVDRILSQKANRFTSYTVADMARDIKPKFIDEDTHLVHCAVTKAIIERYRKANSKIVDLWQECNEALTHIKRRMPVEIGSRPLVKTCAEGIVLPNGMILNYHDLRKSAEGWEYMTKERGPMFTKIYGGKMVENITQALARIVIAHQKLELAAEFKIASSTHDEIVMVVPRDKAEYAMARMADVMDRSPGWAPDLPLASEGGFHKSYGLCDK